MYYCSRWEIFAEYLNSGGRYESYPDDLKYLAINAGASLATFVGIAFLIPMLIRGLVFLARRYWKWLNA
jgi:hypothetical protein